MERLDSLWDAMEQIRLNLEDKGTDRTADEDSLLSKLGDVMLDVTEINLVRSVIKVLKPAFDFTTRVSSARTSTISQVYPAIWQEIRVVRHQVMDPSALASGPEYTLQRSLIEVMESR
ncbi:hypothetical protein BGX28_002351, partial [Mortierella sp. GBA30]